MHAKVVRMIKIATERDSEAGTILARGPVVTTIAQE